MRIPFFNALFEGIPTYFYKLHTLFLLIYFSGFLILFAMDFRTLLYSNNYREPEEFIILSQNQIVILIVIGLIYLS